MQTSINWLVYLAVRVAICIVQAVRMETCAAWANGLAWLVTDVIPLRREVIEDNLRVAYPELSDGERRQLIRRMWRHLFLMVFEIAHVPLRIHSTNWRQYIESKTVREICLFLLDLRPKVIVSGHFGNFEVAGYVAGLLGFPTYTIARPLDNPFLDRFVNRFRRATGQCILPKQGSAELVQRVLDQGGVLALLGDQHAGPKGCWTDFFGRAASSHKAIALFSLTHDAPLAVVCAQRRRGPLDFSLEVVATVDPSTMSPELGSVQALTQWYNQQLEAAVRQAPEQYWWVHRRWKGEPPQAKRRPRAA